MSEPTPFIDGYRLIDGGALNNQLANPSWSISPTIQAKAGGTMANSTKVVQTVTQVTSASAPGAGVTLPQALPGRVFLIINQSTNPITVYAAGDSTINSQPGTLGITQDVADACYYVAVQTKQWYKMSFLPIGFPYQFIENVLNIATLRLWANLPGSSPAQVALVYNTVPNDGGGLFWLDATDHTSVDNGTTIIVDAVGNRWKRQQVASKYITYVPTAPLTATNVQDAIDQLATGKAAWVDTIAQLRALPVVAGAVIFVAGYYAAGDGGGGTYYGVTGGSFANNNGTIITPNSGTDVTAWKLEPTGQVSVRQFGAVGDGITVETAILQTAIENAGDQKLLFPAGTYVTNPLNLVSNLHIVMTPDTVIYAAAGYGLYDRMIVAFEHDNIVIDGNYGILRMRKADYFDAPMLLAQFRHAMLIGGVNNMVVNNLIAEDTGGDGFCIGPGYTNADTSSNIYLNNCTTNNTKRNGLSITCCDGFWAVGCTFKRSWGADPQYGVDVEPDTEDNTISNINLIGCTTSENFAGGIQIVLGAFASTRNNRVSVNVIGHYSYRDSYNSDTAYGGLFFPAVRIANSPSTFTVQGEVNFSDITIVESGGNAIGTSNLNPTLPQINFSNIHILNPGANPANTNTVWQSAISFFTGYDDPGNLGPANMSFTDVTIVDDRSPTVMFTNVYLTSDVGRSLTNLRFQNLKLGAYTNSPYVIGGTLNNVNIVNTIPTIYDSVSSSNAAQFGAGQVITSSTGANLYLEPLASTNGLELEFRGIATPFSIVPQAGESILFSYFTPGQSLVLLPDEHVKLLSTTNGWELVDYYFQSLSFPGSPVGSILPRWIGRMCFDTIGLDFYISTGTGASDWKIIT